MPPPVGHGRTACARKGATVIESIAGRDDSVPAAPPLHPGGAHAGARRLAACVVVDAYSTGNALAGVFRGYGLDCIHVQSSHDIPAPLLCTLRSSDYAHSLVHDGDIDELCRQLRAHS